MASPTDNIVADVASPSAEPPVIKRRSKAAQKAKAPESPASKQKSSQAPVKASRKEIPNGLIYVTTPGLLKKALDKIIEAQQPDRITQNYFGTVWNFTGGSAAAVLAALKKAGFLEQDGKPTDIYSRFRTEGGRSAAARQALHKGYSELFKQNEHADQADEKAITDIIVQVTGRERSDPVVKSILATFKTFSAYVDHSDRGHTNEVSTPLVTQSSSAATANHGSGPVGIGVAYQIYVVLPETSNVEVFNAIFRSLRENLLR